MNSILSIILGMFFDAFSHAIIDWLNTWQSLNQAWQTGHAEAERDMMERILVIEQDMETVPSLSDDDILKRLYEGTA